LPCWDILRDGVKVGRIRWYGRDAKLPGYRVSIGGRSYPCCTTFGQAKIIAGGVAAGTIS
jgi:hypothetical protein